jgi:alpha-glucosidase (family GH31 glycosyl hydrolase)
MALRRPLLPALIALGLCCGMSTVFAQTPARTLLGFADSGHSLELTTADGKYLIKPYSDGIVETTFVLQGQSEDSTSHAVVMQPAAVAANLTDHDGELDYATPGIVVHVQKNPLQISYSYHGRELIAEKDVFSKTEDGERVSFTLDDSEALYGGGSRALGLNRRGNKLRLYNKAHYGYETHSELMNFTMPLVLSSKLYALHFDNPEVGSLDLDSHRNGTLTYQTLGGRMTYQVIAADDWFGLVDHYTQLTGRQPLIPRWALGNFASRFGYHSEAQARDVVQRYRDEHIPLDAIVFDLYWFGKDIKGTLGNLAFDGDNFPQPQQMITDFRKQGVKTVLVTEPFILTTSNRWQEAVNQKILATDKDVKPYTFDFYFGHTGLIDLFQQPARDWFWNIYKGYINEGVAGWWGDLGEPEVHPSDLQHATGSADQVHNIYGHEWAKLLADGYRKDFPQQRPFILMRSGYSGSQRFGLIPWSGDVNRSWGGLQSQPEIALEMGMQGIGYMHSDLGGFANPTLDDELYARWLQYGVFQPIFRPHAQEEVAAEPVFRADKPKALAKQAIELRYRMLPYNYTLAFDNNQTGAPLMRPLLFAEPYNEKLQSDAESYLWGDAFLVTPIVSPAVTAKEIYFPAGSDWFDFYSDKSYSGGNTEAVTVTPEHIPVFVKAGAFVPLAKLVQSTDDYSVQAFELHYYHDASVANSTGKLYDDDGKTPGAFEKGDYQILHFASSYAGKNLTLNLHAEIGGQQRATPRRITLTIHGIAKRPQSVSAVRHALPYRWDAKHKLLQVPVQWDGLHDLTIETRLANLK